MLIASATLLLSRYHVVCRQFWEVESISGPPKDEIPVNVVLWSKVVVSAAKRGGTSTDVEIGRVRLMKRGGQSVCGTQLHNTKSLIN